MADGVQSEFEGVVERIVFFNEENHFCIAKIKPTSKELKKETLVTAKGIMPNIECGETVALKGEWDRHNVYGLQMKVASFESRLPSSVYGIEKFLGSGLIAGIGKEYASRIVKHFGVDTLKIIESESLRLRDVPGIGEKRSDIVETIRLGSAEALISFCRGIQAVSPVDAFVKPEPGGMPGYEDKVIMASGSFVTGSSIELSADGPLRPPYNVYFQGGLTFEHSKLGIMSAMQHMINDELIDMACGKKD